MLCGGSDCDEGGGSVITSKSKNEGRQVSGSLTYIREKYIGESLQLHCSLGPVPSRSCGTVVSTGYARL